MAEEPDLFVARQRFHYHPSPGVPVLVLEHTVARRGHPILEATPEQWVPLQVTFDVEQDEQAMADDTDAEVRRLKQELVGLGVNVDGRWSLARLRKEVDKARAAASG